ncbi:MAG: hypothetical protein ACYTFD_20245 [Planctomycetota bacterium]|jgi:hypothetical protein
MAAKKKANKGKKKRYVAGRVRAVKVEYVEIEGEPIVYRGIELKPHGIKIRGKLRKGRPEQRYRGRKYGWIWHLSYLFPPGKAPKWRSYARPTKETGLRVHLRGSGKTEGMALRSLFFDVKRTEREAAILETRLAKLRLQLENAK